MGYDINSSNDSTVNGWTNYATWRVNLEIVDEMLDSMLSDGRDSFTFLNAGTERADLADYLSEQVEEIVCDFGDADTLAKQYAVAFLGQVNWWEIAENFLSDNEDLVAKDDEEAN